jgi:hypothetical protein
MATIKAACKFCKRPLELRIDDEYAKLRDPYHLLGLASCNKCADFMDDRRKVHGEIKKHAMRLFSREIKKENLPGTREILTKLIQRYMRLIADYRDLPMPDWDNALVDDMLSKPGNYALILGQVPKLFSQPQLV